MKLLISRGANTHRESEMKRCYVVVVVVVVVFLVVLKVRSRVFLVSKQCLEINRDPLKRNKAVF